MRAMETEQDVQRAIRESRERWGRVRLAVAELARYERFTAAMLAEEMGMSRAGVSARLSGTTQITPWEADGFAAVLDVPREWLELDPREALLKLVEADRESESATSRLRAARGFLADAA